MHIAHTKEQQALRDEVRAFIATNVTAEVLAGRGQSESNTAHGRGPGASRAMQELYRKGYDRGWLGIAYPKEYGGQGGDRISQMVGPCEKLPNGSFGVIESGVFAHNLMGSFQSGINHGGAQVMPDPVARRGLEMPRK